jgi:hypothetical protein
MFLLLIIYLLKLSYSQICQINPDPTSISDCYVTPESQNYCCFTEMTYNTTKNNMCILFPKNIAFILPHIKQMNLSTANPIDINIDCGNTNYYNNTCGLPNPKDINDCKKYSNDTNACCLFQSSLSSLCFYNDIKTESTELIFGYTIQCHSIYVVLKYFFIFIILFILI